MWAVQKVGRTGLEPETHCVSSIKNHLISGLLSIWLTIDLPQ